MNSDYLKKMIFFFVIIALGLASRVAYEVSSNPATKSLAVISSGISSSSGGQTLLQENGSAFSGSGDAGADVANSAEISPSASQGSNSVTQSDTSGVSGLQYEAALIANLNDGTIYFGNNDSKRWPLASVTKLMTATVVMDNLNLNQEITITPQEFAADPDEKTLRAGDTYTVSDLLQFLLLPSSNVAAEALADTYGRTNFLNAMNARALAWGMTSTHYDDPSGLSSANQSTADDLLLLAQKIYSGYPGILTITRTTQVYATELGSGKKVLVKSINNFAGEADFIGGKTGYTDVADGNLLSLFEYSGRPVLVVVLGTDDADRFTNTEKLFDWFKMNFK
jgi:D-alanyl-D-alanine carboxypeptidase